MTYLMGVDGGNSKTFTVITDGEGRLLGKGVSGGGNHQTSSLSGAMGHILESVKAALQEAQLDFGDIGFVQFGLAGADREKDYRILRPALSSIPFREWDVVCDTFEGLRTASTDNTGVVLVCGSGFNSAGRNREGRTAQTGGFGYLYGDRTGGGDLANETFGNAVRSWDLREIPSLLTKKVPAFFGLKDMEQLFNDFLDRDISRVPQDLTLVLHEAADEGDELAIRLLCGAGRELGVSANSVIRRLGGSEGFGGAPIPIVLVGSVVQQGRSPHLLGALSDTVAKENDSFELIIPAMAPVYGAVMLAMDRLGLPVTEAIMKQFTAYGGHKT